jgi:adenylate cyclase
MITARPINTLFAYDASDTDEVRLEKFTIFLVSVSCCAAGLAWSAMYYVIFGFGTVALLPFLFVLIVGASLIAAHLSRNHHIAVYTQIACIIYITTFIQWSIGGIFDSGFVLAWAFCGPVIALMYFSLRQSLVWLALYLANIAITVLFDDFFVLHGETVTEGVRTFFFVMNLSVSSLIVFIFASYFVMNALEARENANRLLLNILPAKTAQALKSGRLVVADRFDRATVLFADIVNFTDFSSGLKPDDLVAELNEIFSRFDELTEQFGLEKIKTIGDAYMVAGGVPEPIAEPAKTTARLALALQSEIGRINRDTGNSFALRIGVHIGPVVAGVIGKNKFTYDLWGDTVNVASRMEINALPGTILISEELYEMLKNEFRCEERGIVEIKGKGPMRTYYLRGPLHEGGGE